MVRKVRGRCGFHNEIDVPTEGTREGLCLAQKVNHMARLQNFSKNHINVDSQEDEKSQYGD